MSEDLEKRQELTAWLRDRGHTPEEIAKILAKVDEYDAKTVRESIFDSIDDGSFDFGALIEQALADNK